LALILRLVLVALGVVALFAFVDLKAVGVAMLRMPPGLLALALAIALVDRILMAVKWRHLIRAAGGTADLGGIVRAYFQSGFTGFVVPTAVGPEVLRACLVARLGVPMPLVVASMTVERLVALVSSALLAMSAGFYVGSRVEAETGRIIAFGVGAGLAVALAGLLVALSRRFYAVVERLLRPFASQSLMGLAGRFSDALTAYRRHPGTLGANLGLALAEHSTQQIIIYVVGVALGIALAFPLFFATIALVLFFRRLSGYFESLGVAEAVTIVMYGLLGLTREEAVALSLTSHAVMMAATLPGAVMLLRSGLDVRGWSERARELTEA
jgi:uncharacterized protein (TIRG00374 family)